MSSASGTTTPRSRSRSKRSSTNLSNLRLAPLSSKYEAPKSDARLKSPGRNSLDADQDASFARRHSTYLQGQSAPTTPGILSRSNSRRHLGGGLSRRGSLYGNDGEADTESGYAYGGNAVKHEAGRERAEIGSGNIPKAKSDAALLMSDRQQNRLSGPGVPVSQSHGYRYPAQGRRSGTATPAARRGSAQEESWLTHTGAMTSALVREDKGLSWVTTRQSSTSLAPADSEEDEDDDHYEEMAALSASTAGLRLAQFDGGSPVSTRHSRSNWGSRYGSRSASRRTSRIASPVGTRTPRRSDQAAYFDYPLAQPTDHPGFIPPEDPQGESSNDEREIAQLSNPDSSSFALGNIVDRVVNFNLFNTNEQTDTTDDEGGKGGIRADETAEEAQQRMEAETKRRKGEKEKLTKQPPPAPLGDGKDGTVDVGGWQDAAWLLSVATKALF